MIQAEQTSDAKAPRSGSHGFAHRMSEPVCPEQSIPEEKEWEMHGKWGLLWAWETTVVKGQSSPVAVAGAKGGARGEDRQAGRPVAAMSEGVCIAMLRIALSQSCGPTWWPVGKI